MLARQRLDRGGHAGQRGAQVMPDRREQRGAEAVAFLEDRQAAHLVLQMQAFVRQRRLADERGEQRGAVRRNRVAAVLARDAEDRENPEPGLERMKLPVGRNERIRPASRRLPARPGPFGRRLIDRRDRRIDGPRDQRSQQPALLGQNDAAHAQQARHFLAGYRGGGFAIGGARKHLREGGKRRIFLRAANPDPRARPQPAGKIADHRGDAGKDQHGEDALRIGDREGMPRLEEEEVERQRRNEAREQPRTQAVKRRGDNHRNEIQQVDGPGPDPWFGQTRGARHQRDEPQSDRIARRAPPAACPVETPARGRRFAG